MIIVLVLLRVWGWSQPLQDMAEAIFKMEG